MKKSNPILIKVLAIIILFTINSCIDFYEITTRVNADGSLDRTISVKASDSTSVFKGHIRVPLPGDTSWTIVSRGYQELDKDSKPIKKFEYIATRHFKNIEELNSYLKVSSDTSKEVKVDIAFKKQFRWFYTYVTYTEVYKKYMPFNQFPIENFMSEADLSYIYDDNFTYSREHDSLVHLKDLKQIPVLSRSDSLRAKELESQKTLAYLKFMTINLAAEYVDLVAREYKPISKEIYEYIIGQKDAVMKHEIEKKYLEKLFSNSDKYPFNRIDSMLNITGRSLEKLNPIVYEELSKKINKMLNSRNDKIKCSTVMPGKLLQTNADSISGNQTFWNINENYFFAKDHQLIAKSRLVNNWAFILSGFIALGLLILVLWKNKG